MSSEKTEKVVNLGSRSCSFDGLQVWPVEEFVKALHAGEVFYGGEVALGGFSAIDVLTVCYFHHPDRKQVILN